MTLVERRHRAQAQAALGQSHGRLQDLTDRLITAQEEEWTRIARDLHDDKPAAARHRDVAQMFTSC